MTDAGDESKWAALVGDNEEGDGDEDEDDDDVHVCGGCKEQFSKVEVFVAHKRECKAKRRRKADANSSSRVSVIVDLGKEVTTSSSLKLFQGFQTNMFQSGRRDADEAAVISLLANQLSNNQVPFVGQSQPMSTLD